MTMEFKENDQSLPPELAAYAELINGANGNERALLLRALGYDGQMKKSKDLLGTVVCDLPKINKRVVGEDMLKGKADYYSGSCFACGAPLSPYEQVCSSCKKGRPTCYVRNISQTMLTTQTPRPADYHITATVTGDGAAAVGNEAKAVGKGGVLMEGSINAKGSLVISGGGIETQPLSIKSLIHKDGLRITTQEQVMRLTPEGKTIPYAIEDQQPDPTTQTSLIGEIMKSAGSRIRISYDQLVTEKREVSVSCPHCTVTYSSPYQSSCSNCKKERDNYYLRARTFIPNPNDTGNNGRVHSY